MAQMPDPQAPDTFSRWRVPWPISEMVIRVAKRSACREMATSRRFRIAREMTVALGAVGLLFLPWIPGVLDQLQVRLNYLPPLDWTALPPGPTLALSLIHI